MIQKLISITTTTKMPSEKALKITIYTLNCDNGIQDSRKNLRIVGRSGYNMTYFVTKLSIERIETIKVMKR